MGTVSLYDAANELFGILRDKLSPNARDLVSHMIDQDEFETIMVFEPYLYKYKPQIHQKYKEVIFDETGIVF